MTKNTKIAIGITATLGVIALGYWIYTIVSSRTDKAISGVSDAPATTPSLAPIQTPFVQPVGQSVASQTIIKPQKRRI